MFSEKNTGTTSYVGLSFSLQLDQTLGGQTHRNRSQTAAVRPDSGGGASVRPQSAIGAAGPRSSCLAQRALVGGRVGPTDSPLRIGLEELPCTMLPHE